MLESIFKSDDKVHLKMEEHYKKGLELIEKKLYKQAMFEFGQAMELDHDLVYKQLSRELEVFSSQGNYEGSLSIGLNLLKKKPNDHELANQLGNYARQLGDYKQANNLYRHSLKVNKTYELALYNLAACMGRIDYYDEHAISAVNKFNSDVEYIIPEYIGGKNIINEIKEQLKEKAKKELEEKIQELMIEKETKEKVLKPEEITKLEEKITGLRKTKPEVTPEMILAQLSQKIEDLTLRKNNYFDLFLFALSIQKLDEAEDALNHIHELDPKFYLLDLLAGLLKAKQGKIDDAIDHFVKLLGKHRYNRFYNANLGLLYRKKKNRLLSFKYLILASWLLEKSDGEYDLRKVMQIADQKFEDKRLKEALGLYHVIVEEIKSTRAWSQIGEIHLVQNRHEEAIIPYKKLLRIDPKSTLARQKLEEIHDFFVEKAKSLAQEMKMKPAAENYEKALKALRNADTIQETATIYRQLKNTDKEEALLKEWHTIKDKEKRIAQEKRRQEQIILAKAFLKKKHYLKAIEHYENAFRLKLDKNVFLALAQIYKALKKQQELESLLQRWNRMVEHEEKLQKYERNKERTSKGEAQEAD